MSDSEQCSNRLELDLVSLLVNFSCELGQIMTRYVFLPRWNVVHDFMNRSWTFMNVHEQFMKSSYNTRIVGSWTKVHEQFTITVHELFKNLLWKKIVHEQFINSSWKVHINKRSWTVHHQFMNCSRTYYEPKNSSWTVHKQFVES